MNTDGCDFRTHKNAWLDILEYIEGWYNPHRSHASIVYHTPIAYEVGAAMILYGK